MPRKKNKKKRNYTNRNKTIEAFKTESGSVFYRVVSQEKYVIGKKKSTKFKSFDAYVRSQYFQNKAFIDKNISDTWIKRYGTPFQAFKELIEEKMAYTNPKTKKNFTPDEAVRRIVRSKDLNKTWTNVDIYGRNFQKLINKNPEIKKKFYELEGIGKYTNGKGSPTKRIEYNQYRFEGYYMYNNEACFVYSYGSTYFIEKVSPKAGAGATLIAINKATYDDYLDKGTLIFITRRKG